VPVRRRRALLRAAAGLVLVGAAVLPAVTAAPPREAASWRLERGADGLYLDARIPLELPVTLLDALHRGVPLHFVWRAELRRPRWYWTDRHLARAVRTVRLVYQPLTQRWRLSVQESDAPDGGSSPAALHRNLDSLDEALGLARSVQRWRVAASDGLRGDERLEVEFRLDARQLPRPLQILPGGSAEAPVWRAVLAMPAPGDTETAEAMEARP
jgi:hypothetical protein